MLRAVLVGFLTVSAGAACGSKDDAPAVPIGAAAGRVVDVTGSVQATRNGAARPLATGAEVYPDDVVSTTAGGSVVIELFHNHARWSVESGRTARVDASLAWGLAKQQASAPVEHATAAAGRNAERSAADTGATAAPAAESAPAAPVVAPPAELPKAEPRARAEAKPERARRADERADDDAPARGGAANEAPTLPPPPPPPPIDRAAPAGGGAGKGGGGAAPSPGGAAPDAIGGGEEGGGAPPARAAAALPTLEAVLARHRPKFVACLDAATPKAEIAVVVRGGVARFVTTGASPAVRACIERVGASLKLTIDGRATLAITK